MLTCLACCNELPIPCWALSSFRELHEPGVSGNLRCAGITLRAGVLAHRRYDLYGSNFQVPLRMALSSMAFDEEDAAPPQIPDSELPELPGELAGIWGLHQVGGRWLPQPRPAGVGRRVPALH